jgi:hypothetical protein
MNADPGEKMRGQTTRYFLFISDSSSHQRDLSPDFHPTYSFHRQNRVEPNDVRSRGAWLAIFPEHPGL